MQTDRNQTEIKKGRLTPLSAIMIQGAVIIYTCSSICSKMAASNKGHITILGNRIGGLSLIGYLWLCLEIGCLGFYAILWQQIIKRYDLSIAYANRAFAVFWTFLWGILLFHEKVRPFNLVGILMVFFGILLVNQDAK